MIDIVIHVNRCIKPINGPHNGLRTQHDGYRVIAVIIARNCLPVAAWQVLLEYIAECMSSCF